MTAPLVYLIAGEPSGDLLAGRLMAALKDLTGGRISFAGIGGETMQDQGLESLFPQADLAVMGLAEVLPRLRRILKRLDQTVADIARRRPAAIVTVDSWGFTGRVAKRLKQQGSTVPRIHYVAPMVWAWKEKRAYQLAGRVDLLMCLLANEPPYFARAGVEAVHVGHAVLESGAERGDGAAFRARHAISADAPLICVLPGSRRSETSRLLPVFAETVRRLAAERSGLRVALPTVATVADDVRRAAAVWPVPVTVVDGAGERYDAFAASRVALAASGTVALELALAGLPMVIAYRVAPLTALVARRVLNVRHVCLLNLLTGSPVVPELLQEECRADRLVPILGRLMDDEAMRAGQLSGAGEALRRLGVGGELPSSRAARHVLRLMQGKEGV
jgi:lipid-A-disaccharide synthase